MFTTPKCTFSEAQTASIRDWYAGKMVRELEGVRGGERLVAFGGKGRSDSNIEGSMYHIYELPETIEVFDETSRPDQCLCRAYR